MINWNALVVGPMMDTFGQPVSYTPAGGQAVPITATFVGASLVVDPLIQPGAVTHAPRLGVQVSQLPAGWDAENAEGDTFTVIATGKNYRVTVGKADGRGHAMLQATEIA